MGTERWGAEPMEFERGGVTVKTAQASGVYYRAMWFKAGAELPQLHVHTFDHVAVVAGGTVALVTEGSDTAIEGVAPAMLTVPAGKLHRFVALSDALVVCLHLAEPGERISWKPDAQHEELTQQVERQMHEIRVLRDALARTALWQRDHPGDGPEALAKYVEGALAASHERLP